MVTKQKDSRLRVIITDADTEKPIENLPVWCYQPGTKWDHIAVNTNAKGEAEFNNLRPCTDGTPLAEYGVNFGGKFDYEQLPKPLSAGIFSNQTTVRRHKLHRKITTTQEPSTVPRAQE
jgi:hypothetical protein